MSGYEPVATRKMLCYEITPETLIVCDSLATATTSHTEIVLPESICIRRCNIACRILIIWHDYGLGHFHKHLILFVPPKSIRPLFHYTQFIAFINTFISNAKRQKIRCARAFFKCRKKPAGYSFNCIDCSVISMASPRT